MTLPYVIGGIILATLSVMIPDAMEKKYQEGIQEGKRIVLNTNPVSEELEITCAGLWVGEQNKKAQHASTTK